MPNVLIAGGSGLIGMRLSEMLSEKGYIVSHLSRKKRPDGLYTTYQWDVKGKKIDAEAIKRADYVLNLAGAGIADKRWTEARKKEIIDSRVESARLLLNSFKEHGFPKAYISSAAIGYYGDAGEEEVDETAMPGSGFLSESCVLWEAAIAEIMATQVRTVALRIGVVLSTKGGALQKVLEPFNFRLGAYFGDGKQWFPWIHIDDVSQMFVFALETEQMEGIYNAVAPNPIRNKVFTDEVAQAIGKPSLVLPAPAFALKLMLGELASAVLNSTKVSSKKIEGTGFSFQYPEIKTALKDLIEKKI